MLIHKSLKTINIKGKSFLNPILSYAALELKFCLRFVLCAKIIALQIAIDKDKISDCGAPKNAEVIQDST